MTKQGQKLSPNKHTKSRIPTFKTIEEAAEFWDEHSLADFEDELEEVTDVRFVPHQPKKAITVRLPEDTVVALTREAKTRGIGLSTLVRIWILEHLRGVGPEQC